MGRKRPRAKTKTVLKPVNKMKQLVGVIMNFTKIRITLLSHDPISREVQRSDDHTCWKTHFLHLLGPSTAWISGKTLSRSNLNRYSTLPSAKPLTTLCTSAYCTASSWWDTGQKPILLLHYITLKKRTTQSSKVLTINCTEDHDLGFSLVLLSTPAFRGTFSLDVIQPCVLPLVVTVRGCFFNCKDLPYLLSGVSINRYNSSTLLLKNSFF